jgi:hypothetical protein
MKSTLLFVTAALPILLRCAPAPAQSVGMTPDEIHWAETRGLGLAAQLEGDPAKQEPYVVRIKVPPNNVTSPHTHPQAENVTVISGWIGFGNGTVFDRSKGRVLPAGSFLYLPANTAHFAWTGPEGAVIQAHGVGPFP